MALPSIITTSLNSSDNVTSISNSISSSTASSNIVPLPHLPTSLAPPHHLQIPPLQDSILMSQGRPSLTTPTTNTYGLPTPESSPGSQHHQLSSYGPQDISYSLHDPLVIKPDIGSGHGLPHMSLSHHHHHHHQSHQHPDLTDFIPSISTAIGATV